MSGTVALAASLPMTALLLDVDMTPVTLKGYGRVC